MKSKLKSSTKAILTIGTFCSIKFSSRLNFATAVCDHYHSQTFYQWSEKWFNGKELQHSPVYKCKAESIKVLQNPQEFYEELKVSY